MSQLGSLPGFRHIDHISITVPDLDGAVDWYGKILGAQVAYRLGPLEASEMPVMPDGRDWTEAHVDVQGAQLSIAMMKLGPNLMVEFFQYDKPSDANKEYPRNCDIGGHHFAINVDKLEPALTHLQENGCSLMDGPIEIPEGPTAGCRSQYLRDPWGNYLELMEYKHQEFMNNSEVRPFGYSN